LSERGVFAVDRGIWEHPSFADEPFTEREAWAWLVGEAAFKPRKKRVGNTVFDLRRGQAVMSIRFMAEAWQWHRNRVFRFLARLKTETMIDQQAGRDATVITVCNYDKYQRVSLPDVTASGTRIGTPTGHQRDKLEDTENKEEGILEGSAGGREVAQADGWPGDYRDQFWARYPNKVGKPKALAKLDGIRRRAVLVPWSHLMDGLDRYIRTKPPDRQWLNPETFLNQERWTDQPAAVAAQGSQNGRRTVHDAANDLLAKINALDEPAPGGLCDGTGQGPVRLLSSR
jgi:quinol monooxygenase YgiN